MGQWTTPEDSIVTMVHGALLYTGKVLMWGTLQRGFNSPPVWTPAELYDPTTDTITDVSTTFNVDMVCADQSTLPNGDIMVSGAFAVPIVLLGSGTTDTTLFNPRTETWSQGSPLNYARWYATNVELGNGDTMVSSGHSEDYSQTSVQQEVYSQTTGTWTVLPPSADNPDYGPNWLYPRLDLLPNGNIFKSAPRQMTTLFNPTTNTWKDIGNMNYGSRFYAGAVLLPNSYKVMVVGGTPTNADNGGTVGTATTETIDLSVAKPVWTYGPSMNIGRFDHTTFYLADGSLIVVGGNQGPGHYGAPVFTPEIYNFTTQQWTEMNPQLGVRAYHSVAVLLPDGRVFSVGSTSNTTYAHYYEIFSPPYLFNGARPTITGVPTSITYGQQFTITTPDANNISSVALILPGATTHANDMQQRYVPLTFTVGNGSLTATAPPNGNYAPPNYYMLSIVNSNGVPAVMPFVQLQLSAPKQQR